MKVAADRVSAETFTVETVERGEEAVARAASAADVVVVVAGNDPHVNGRATEDRTTLALPAHQDRLWRAAHAANPRTVLVLVSACPYAVPEAAAALPALLWTAHGGQAPGASSTLAFALPLSGLGHWDVAHGRRVVEPGAYEIQAGASSGDIRREVLRFQPRSSHSLRKRAPAEPTARGLAQRDGDTKPSS